MYSVYRVKTRDSPRAFTIRGLRYEHHPSTGVLKIFGWVGDDTIIDDEEVFTSSHNSWEWIRKIDERDN